MRQSADWRQCLEAAHRGQLTPIGSWRVITVFVSSFAFGNRWDQNGPTSATVNNVLEIASNWEESAVATGNVKSSARDRCDRHAQRRTNGTNVPSYPFSWMSDQSSRSEWRSFLYDHPFPIRSPTISLVNGEFTRWRKLLLNDKLQFLLDDKNWGSPEDYFLEKRVM